MSKLVVALWVLSMGIVGYATYSNVTNAGNFVRFALDVERTK